jgi:4'-phosphopantetheinyl transferase
MNHFENLATIVSELSEKKIHVFLLKLDVFNYEELFSCLTTEEQSRANKLRIDDKRKQFVITRGLLKKILSIISNKEPKAISLLYEEHGKPYTNIKYNKKNIEFNVSHSGDYALIAISLDNKVGVDIEKINIKIDNLSLSNRFFSEIEKNALLELESDKQLDAFYQTWVKKESFIKAVGKGVAFGLDKFSVPINNDNQTMKVIVSEEEPNGSAENWYCQKLLELDHFKTAITTCNKNIDIIMTRYCN